MTNFEKFYTMTPMRYYDCGGNYKSPKAQEMLQNKDGGFIATRKNDGEWCRIIIDAKGNVTAQSRSISKVTGEYGNKTELIPHIIEECRSFPRETVLLGELCFADITKTSKDVGAILRCKPDKAIARQKEVKLLFKVFDCLAFGGIDLSDAPYSERWINAMDAVGDYGNYISLTSFVEYDDFEEFLQEILAGGGEGIVIHRKSAKYKPGARTAWDTLKVKKITEELELPIVSFIEPNKAYCGGELATWKYWEEDTPVTKPYFMGWKNGVVVMNQGTLVRVTSGLTDEDREWLATSEAQELLVAGQLTAVVSCMETTSDFSLRHPRLVRIRTEA